MDDVLENLPHPKAEGQLHNKERELTSHQENRRARWRAPSRTWDDQTKEIMRWHHMSFPTSVTYMVGPNFKLDFL